MTTSDAFTATRNVKTCFRCGRGIVAATGRVCSTCRKPRVRPRTIPINRGLSFRERQIAELIYYAKLNKEIAFDLGLTEGTVKQYLNGIYRKLGVKNRTELALWAVRNLRIAA